MCLPQPFLNRNIIKLIEVLLKIINYLSIIIKKDLLPTLIAGLINRDRALDR